MYNKADAVCYLYDLNKPHGYYILYIINYTLFLRSPRG